MTIKERYHYDEEIYLIKTTDPVQGGEGGIDNIPHQQLANRTKFLKNELDAQAIKIRDLQEIVDELEGSIANYSDFQEKIDKLTELVNKIQQKESQNNNDKSPKSAFCIFFKPVYASNDQAMIERMSISTNLYLGGFAPVARDGEYLKSPKTVTIPEWVTNPSQIVMVFNNNKVDNPHSYVDIDIHNHIMTIRPPEYSGQRSPLAIADSINVTIY